MIIVVEHPEVHYGSNEGMMLLCIVPFYFSKCSPLGDGELGSDASDLRPLEIRFGRHDAFHARRRHSMTSCLQKRGPYIVLASMNKGDKHTVKIALALSLSLIHIYTWCSGSARGMPQPRRSWPSFVVGYWSHWWPNDVYEVPRRPGSRPNA
jgi:hypothetical protein